MADMEKVIKALRLCLIMDFSGRTCMKCPYLKEENCNGKLLDETLVLLRGEPVRPDCRHAEYAKAVMHTQATERKVEMTREEAVAKLEGAANMATCVGCSLAKLPVKDALEIANFLRDQEPKKRESRAMLPCRCGGKLREHWYGIDSESLVCKRCGFSVIGKNNADVIRRWNEAVKQDG